MCLCVREHQWLPKPLDWHTLDSELPNSQGEKVSYLTR